MNRADIRNLVIDHTGASHKVDLINSMITAALKKVSSEMRWGDLLTEGSVTLIPNQEYITLGTNIHRITEVRIIDGLSSWEIDVRTKSWVVERWPSIADEFSQRPRYGYLENSRLYLMPAPDTNWTLKYSYYGRLADLTDETTELFPEHIDECVISYATYRTFKSLQQHEDSVAWYADYQDALKGAKAMEQDSAIVHQATPRGMGTPHNEDDYLDPFIRSVP